MTSDSNPSYSLTPSWKHFFFGYMLSILTIPLFGAGLVAFFLIRKKHRQIRYRITNQGITRTDEKYEHNIDLTDIERIELRKTQLQEWLKIGTLILHTSAFHMKLEGIEEPEQLSKLLEQAIETERKRLQARHKTNPREPQYQPGSIDKMEYLTGLWQQGLLSDEDYEKERKHFE